MIEIIYIDMCYLNWYCELRCWYDMNWWIGYEYWLLWLWCELLLRNDELLEIEWLVDWFVLLSIMMWIWIVFVLRIIWLRKMLRNEMLRNEMLRCWWWKNELSYWECGFENCWIEIELMKFVNLFELMNYVNCMCLMVMSWLF